MKTILLFGAGKSATVLIEYLITESKENGWKFIVADANLEQILQKTNNAPSTEAVELDITNDDKRAKLINRAHVVISMMPPHLHFLIAKDCVEYRKHLLTASYLDQQIKSLQDEINDRKLLFLCEMGLDPGIDHMSAMSLLNKIKKEGGKITSFKSHCGGLVAPESDNNPWHYKISWNPRNVVLAGKAGAVYKDENNIISESYTDLFSVRRNVEVNHPEIGNLSYYPNRDSLPYIQLYKLEDVKNFVRTTLRHPLFMYGWKNIIALKLTDETVQYETDGMSLKTFFQTHIKNYQLSNWLSEKFDTEIDQNESILKNLFVLMDAESSIINKGDKVHENYMIVDNDGDLQDIPFNQFKSSAIATVAQKVLHANLLVKQLSFLGLNDDQTIINKGKCSAADVLQFALENKLVLSPTDKDMVVMVHEIEFEQEGKNKKVNSSLVVKGENSLHTAMAKTVGLPLGIAAKLILDGNLTLKGLHIPTHKNIYEPVLKELENCGIKFIESEY